MINMAQGTRTMDEYQYLPAVLTALSGLFAIFVGGAKWMFGRMDAKAAAERVWQNEERKKLELSFEKRIATLDQIIKNQNEEINRMRNQVASYSRHVGMLEGVLRAKNIEVPHIPGGLSNEY
jgi:uncharacterized protein HemX